MVFSKMLAKIMSLIELKIAMFSTPEGGTPPQKLLRGNSPSDTRFLDFQRFIKVLTKASKQEKWEDLQTW